MTMATKAATSTPIVQSEIDRIREEICTHEVAIFGRKQQLAEQSGKLPKSKIALAGEIYLKHQDDPRAEVIKALSAEIERQIKRRHASTKNREYADVGDLAYIRQCLNDALGREDRDPPSKPKARQ
jgi:hypothetical protein